MASKNIRFPVMEKGTPLVATTAEKPQISEPNEVIIRLKAIAINPADFKMIDQGARGTSWPLVAGMDGSGIVEAASESVKNVAIGDEVLACFTPGDRSGSYQTFAVVQNTMVAKKPTSWSFEDAATLGVCYVTALVGLGVALKISLPFLRDGPISNFKPSSILVLGGSSALGAATIQLLHLALPSCRILTTASPKHHKHIATLGAASAFDRNSTSLISEIKAATSKSQGVDAIIDTVGAGATERHIFEAFDSNGPRRYAQVWTGDDEIKVPSGVESIMWRSRQLSELQGGENIMQALQSLLEEGKYKLPLPVNNVGRGLEGLQKGLDLMRKGVSGEKLVATL